MVDINGKNYSDILKIKGTDKKIDLTKLEGLQKTKQNQAIFDMVDKNKDGVIDEQEATILQNNLLTSSKGDGKISEREANNHYGKNNNTFDAIKSLADQQAQTIKGEKYIEKNGDITTYVYNSNNGDEFSYKYDSKTNADGTITHTFPDGSQEIQRKDGTKYTIQKDGTIINKDKDGNTVSVMKNGNTTTYPDENTTITKNVDGQTIQTIVVNGEKITRTDFEYQDGKTIEREYSDVWENTPLSSITVREKKDGHNVDTKYATEEDMTNNRPSEIITDTHNPTQKTTTKFTYNEDGSYSTETTNSAGEKTVKNFGADGKEIVEQPKPEIPTTHKVIKGESITKIVTDALAQQGIENPTPEQLKEAKKEFLELNKDLVKTYKGVKKEWHGNKFFYPDDVVKLPNFAGDKPTVKPQTKTEKEVPPAVLARQQEVQAQLGDKYKVTINEEGKIEVRTQKGGLLPDATKKANDGIKTNKQEENGEILQNATKLANAQGNLSENDLAIVTAYDGDSSRTLNKNEFSAMIYDQLAEFPESVIETNKEQIQTLIDEAFAKVDAQNKDNELTSAELKQNMNTAIKELANKIDTLEQHGLQINANGELEDIPTPKSKRKK